jgi:N-acetyl-beta-hexosaminidase
VLKAPKTSIRGIEAPIWSETFVTDQRRRRVLAFPRIAAGAEVAWLPQDSRA